MQKCEVMQQMLFLGQYKLIMHCMQLAAPPFVLLSLLQAKLNHKLNVRLC